MPVGEMIKLIVENRERGLSRRGGTESEVKEDVVTGPKEEGGYITRIQRESILERMGIIGHGRRTMAGT